MSEEITENKSDENKPNDNLNKAITDWKTKRQTDDKAKKKWPFWAQLLTIFGIAFVISVFIRVFLFQPFIVPSGSMRPTLMENDRILVSKLYPKPMALNRQDIIVFRDPGGWLALQNIENEQNSNALTSVLEFFGLSTPDDEYLTKRLIGMPGDHITCDGNGGPVKVNGEAIDNSYIPEGAFPSQVKIDEKVPDNMIYVLGDNRANSADSRFNKDKEYNGFVPMQNVVGKVIAIIWPPDRFKTF
ncbi:MAG: signal peptidase I [Bifidobacteriaceae bacterium]|jgi:signal peptidase I|nr:signal peptidase I [Bifidobacteriaceae bacterium]